MSEPGRTRCTDDRLDDLAHEIRALRTEMREGFQSLRSELHGEIGGVRTELSGLRSELSGLRSETHADSRSLWEEMARQRRWVANLWATTVLGFVAVVIQVSLR